MIYYFLGITTIIFIPIGLFELGKWSVRRQLKENIIKLEEIKENSNDEMTSLIQIHLDELEKIDKGLFVLNRENKNL